MLGLAPIKNGCAGVSMILLKNGQVFDGSKKPSFIGN